MSLTRLLGLPENQAKHRTSLGTALGGLGWGLSSTIDATPGPGVLPSEGDLTPPERALLARLRQDVEALAAFPARNVFAPVHLRACEEHLRARLASTGHAVEEQAYPSSGVTVRNLLVEHRGASRPDEVVVVGAHYDSVELKDEVRAVHGNCPGANDNGSGVAATLALHELLSARAASGERPARTVRFVLFANEEPPFFWTEEMGSLVCARRCVARRENVVAMLTPETLGYYTGKPGTQRLPFGILRSKVGGTGDFLAFMGLASTGRAKGGAQGLMRQCVGAFREATSMRCLGAVLPAIVPMVGASDHWSFWRCGYPALMVTDTAPFRYDFYHQWRDRAEALHWPGFARAVVGLDSVVRRLAG
jgi:hypothetical protein